MLPKTSAYVKGYGEQTKWMYNTIWHKVSADMKKEYDSEPVYNKEFIKTKIRSHDDEVTDFHDKKFLRWTLIILF